MSGKMPNLTQLLQKVGHASLLLGTGDDNMGTDLLNYWRREIITSCWKQQRHSTNMIMKKIKSSVHLCPEGGAHGCQTCLSCNVKCSSHCCRSRDQAGLAAPKHWAKSKIQKNKNIQYMHLPAGITQHYNVDCSKWVYLRCNFIIFISIYDQASRVCFSTLTSTTLC